MAHAMAKLSDQPIVNRVAQSSLVTLDLGDFYPKGKRLELDIAPWLYEGLMVKETEFRAHLAALDLATYRDAWVRIFCSADALLPAWTFPLVSLTLAPVCRQSFVGSWTEFDQWAIADAIAHLDTEPLRDKPVMVKGCGQYPIPDNAYLMLAQKIQPLVRSLMYGEACSSVPLYKKPKT